MARRRQEIALQTEIETQEEWNEAINKEGLTVVDVYQTYGGPCKALEAKFRSIKNTLGDPLLNFAIAKADTIDSLDKFRGRCEPCFLFYATGVLVDSVIGANAPELQRKILSNLEQEKKILKEGGERIEHRVQLEGEAEDEEPGKARHRSPSIVNAIASQQYTIAVIRPDAYASGKTDDIADKIVQQGFRILLQQERHLTEHEARELHHHMMNEEGYEEHIKLMTSGPSVVLLIQHPNAKESTIDDFRELINSDETWKEVVDCTKSPENLQRELKLLLPDVVDRPLSHTDKPLERTLALIRPSATKLFKDAIIKRIEENGFEVVRSVEVQLTQAQVEEFYASKKDLPFYQDLIQEMISGPSLALYLIKKDAIQHFRTLLGPADKIKIKEAAGTFRHEFDVVDTKINSLHAPRSRAEVNRNLRYFFPEERIFVILKPSLTEAQKFEIEGIFRKAGFFVLARKVDQLSADKVAQILKQHQNQENFDELSHYMTSGQSVLLLLVKENAAKSWLDIVGPPNPADATDTAPTSIRSVYGKDLIHNAVEVIWDPDEVKTSIDLVFEDFDKEHV